MKRFGLSVATAVLLAYGPVGSGAGVDMGVALAAPKKEAKTRGSAKDKAAPVASSNEIASLKSEFKWGMTPDEVADKVAARVEASFKEQIAKTAGDPTANDQVRKQMRAEVEKSRKNLVRFDGQKTGYDVSIIDQEFAHGLGESMLAAKEDNGSRYFFFNENRLYKMFIAFDKETLAGKDFSEFGQLMQARFGKAKDVRFEEKTKEGVRYRLDHFEWGSKAGDGLRLVDRSEFYDVYCLVVYDGGVEARLGPIHRERRKVGNARDSIIEAALAGKTGDLDPNDDVVERATGKSVPHIGRRAENIRVPSPGAARDSTSTSTSAPEPEAPQKKTKASKRGGKEGGKETEGMKL